MDVVHNEPQDQKPRHTAPLGGRGDLVTPKPSPMPRQEVPADIIVVPALRPPSSFLSLASS